MKDREINNKTGLINVIQIRGWKDIAIYEKKGKNKSNINKMSAHN